MFVSFAAIPVKITKILLSLRYINYYVTEFVKRSLIHASDYGTLMIYNFVCD